MYLYILSYYPLLIMMDESGLAGIFFTLIFLPVLLTIFKLIPIICVIYLPSAWVLQKFIKERLTADIWFLAKLDIIPTVIFEICFSISKSIDLSIIVSALGLLGLLLYHFGLRRFSQKKPLASRPQKTNLLKSIGRWALALLCCFGLFLASAFISISIYSAYTQISPNLN